MADYQTISQKVYCEDCGVAYYDTDGHQCAYHECDTCNEIFHDPESIEFECEDCAMIPDEEKPIKTKS